MTQRKSFRAFLCAVTRRSDPPLISAVEHALTGVLAEGSARTPDLGGSSTTQEVTEAVIARLSLGHASTA